MPETQDERYAVHRPYYYGFRFNVLHEYDRIITDYDVLLALIWWFLFGVVSFLIKQI